MDYSLSNALKAFAQATTRKITSLPVAELKDALEAYTDNQKAQARYYNSKH